MKHKPVPPANGFQRGRRIGVIYVGASAAVLLTLLYVDRQVLQRGIIAEGPPLTDFPHLLRTAAIALASGLAVMGAVRLGTTSAEFPSTDGWPASTPGQWLAAGLPLLIAASLTLVFAVDARVFRECVREDGAVEMLSALFALGAGVILLATWMRERRGRDSRPLLSQASVVLTGLACIVIAGEEVSWLQRQVGYETPATFPVNNQGEFNFHNFQTDRIENAYYLCAFVLTVLAPFVREVIPGPPFPAWIRSLLPGRFVACAGAIAVGFNYDMWTIVPIQAAFFATVGILIWFIHHGRGAMGGRLMPALTLFFLLANQALFLARGHTMLRSWDGTEVKELLIPLALLYGSLEVFARAGTAGSNTPRSSRAG